MLGGIAAIIFIVNLGPLALFAISLAILYYAFKGFMKADTSLTKVAWAVFGLILFSITASNAPAIVGVLAAIVLYFVYKKWNEEKHTVIEKKETNDPFTNFEKEWAQLKRNY